mmetsp:Transcript_5167/g.8005  ORF Transcript_5167/g.8005 Transcript_5167/m.8005 type:complete len:317 (-) Transcript_5167:177-1127(-)
MKAEDCIHATSTAESQEFLESLPAVRGRYIPDFQLSKLTWFGVGGKAQVLFQPADVTDLASFLSQSPKVPITVIGVGSNLLVRDGGVPGVVVRLGKAFAQVKLLQDGLVEAGASALDVAVARACRDAGITGFEFLSGIPGSIGGALRMNAGAYGSDMSRITVSATAVDSVGNIHEVDCKELGFSYRHSSLPSDWIFVGAKMRGSPGIVEEISRRMAEISSQREESQPVKSRTGGSTFRNPSDSQGKRAWELIDAVGGRGLRVGGAQVSEKHCNFLINTGNATAADLEDLGDELVRRVREQFGVELHWEIERVGFRE